MPLLRRFLLSAVIVLATFACRAQDVTYTESSVTIDTAKGALHFAVEMALTPEQQEHGLMFRSELAPADGMLFVLPEVATATFWMKDTLIPLDMLFIGDDGKIDDIHERAVPMSEDLIVSKVPVRAVLEVNGGTVDRLAIAPGDVVHHAVFGNAED
jgi:uncharacterized protein